MKRFVDWVAECRAQVREIYPWDLKQWLDERRPVLVVDVREPQEYAAAHIGGTLNVPRGILETAAEWGYEDTVPALADARAQPIVVLCRSGNRSLLAARTLQEMGFAQVVSVHTGVRGWNDDEYPLVDGAGAAVTPEAADATLRPTPRAVA